MKQPCVYILASGRNGTLYIGVTSNFPERISMHKLDLLEGFGKRHQIHDLVYYEMFSSREEAVKRKRRLKEWPRAWQLRLIEQMNPEWVDLHDEQSGAFLEGPADQERIRG